MHEEDAIAVRPQNLNFVAVIRRIKFFKRTVIQFAIGIIETFECNFCYDWFSQEFRAFELLRSGE